MDIFTSIGATITAFNAMLRQISLSGIFKDAQLFISLLLTISIIWKGYLVLAGKNSDPIRDLIFDLGKKSFILVFVMNYGGYLQYATDAVQGFHEWAMTIKEDSGGSNTYVNMYKTMDGIADNFLTSLRDGYIKAIDGWLNIGDKIIAFLMALVMIVSFISVCLSLFFTIIATQITNIFLVVSLPLALFCLMWQPTKQVFTQWLNLFISNIFILLFLTALMKFFGEWMGSIFNLGDYFGNNTSFLQMLIEIPLISAALVQIINVIKELARNLAQVTLDTAVNGSVFMGAMGAASGMIGKAMQGKVSQAGNAMQKGAESIVGGAGKGKAMEKAGGFAGKAVQKGKQLLSSMRNK